MSNDLKPCLCGKIPQMINDGSSFIKCSCGIELHLTSWAVGMTQAEATVKQWNTRPQSAQPSSALTRARKEEAREAVKVMKSAITYGKDTLSGNVVGPNDAKFYADGVVVMIRRLQSYIEEAPHE